MSFAARYGRFHELAAQASGFGDFSDFGPTDYVEPLKILLSDYDRYCRFTEMGAALERQGQCSDCRLTLGLSSPQVAAATRIEDFKLPTAGWRIPESHDAF